MKKLLKQIVQWLAAWCGLPTFFELHALVDLVEKNVNEARQKLSGVDQLLEITRASFHPVVLFTGTMFLPGKEQNKRTAICDYAWAEKANPAAVSSNGDYVVTCQPNCTIRLDTIEVLNGPYDIVRCQIANIDLIATSEGVFPPQKLIPVPEDLGIITPANRIYILLKSR